MAFAYEIVDLGVHDALGFEPPRPDPEFPYQVVAGGDSAYAAGLWAHTKLTDAAGGPGTALVEVVGQDVRALSKWPDAHEDCETGTRRHENCERYHYVMIRWTLEAEG